MFPVLLPAIVAYALFVDNWRRKDSVMHWVGQGLALAMIVGSCVYYLPKHDWVKRHGPRHYVIKSAAQVGRYAKAESDWNEYQYVVLEPNERLWVDIPDEPTGYGISVATDHNDIYEIRIIGEQETRIIDIGMKEATGIAIFNEHLVPPVSKVKAIEVRPRGGDVHYSVGHLILNPAGYNRPYTLPPDPPPKPAQADPLKPGQPAPLPKPGEATARDPGGSRQEVGAFGAASGKALQVSPGAASGKALQVSPGAASGKARQASPGAASGKARQASPGAASGKARQARPDAASGKSPSARPGAASGKSQPKSPGAAKPPRRKP